MPTYSYKARDATGKLIKGTMDASVKEELIDKLHKMGYMATGVTGALPGINIESVFEKLKRVSSEDMIMFNLQLSNMINAGIDILASLNTLVKQIENKRLKEAVGDIARNIEGGSSLSQSLARYPQIFPSLFVSMVKVGEASGKLGNILLKYAHFCEQQQDLRQKIKGALFYPAILLFAGTAVTLFIVTFIIPQFVQVFLEAGIRLPALTLILYKVGIGIKFYWYLIALFIVICWLGIRVYVKTERGKLKLDKFKLKMPIIGPLHRKTTISRFSRTLSMLLAGGVNILESLEIVKEVVGNEVVARVIENTRGCVERGEGIAESLKISEEFPPDTIQMISVGENAGNLAQMLNKISDFYDTYIGYAVKKLTTIIEPLFLIVMGSIVGFIMASLLLPTFDMVKVLRH